MTGVVRIKIGTNIRVIRAIRGFFFWVEKQAAAKRWAAAD
jgi:hypothetical protein